MTLPEIVGNLLITLDLLLKHQIPKVNSTNVVMLLMVIKMTHASNLIDLNGNVTGKIMTMLVKQ